MQHLFNKNLRLVFEKAPDANFIYLQITCFNIKSCALGEKFKITKWGVWNLDAEKIFNKKNFGLYIKERTLYLTYCLTLEQWDL